jgi:hypothetical protein
MNKLEAVLKALGTNPMQVAQSLSDSGVRGNREDTCGCPLGNLLAKLGWEDPYVQGNYAKAFMGCQEITAALPEAVRGFLSDFDRGCWPDLVR